MSYIGSKINVTTRSGNQYDGVLTSVNAKEKTIELQMVKLVATQGRPVKDGTVYEFVVFKSDDIEDLQVYNEPVPQQQPTYSDPAIVSAKPAARKYTEQQPPKANGSVAFGVVEQEKPAAKPVKSLQSQVVSSETIHPATFAAAAAAQAAPTFSPRRSGGETAQDYSFMKTQKVRSYSTITKQTTQVDVPVSIGNDQQGNRKPNRPVGPFIPKSEFDFEQANQLFDKEQVAAEVAPVLSGDGPYYSRKSFFDNISTETSPASGPEGEKARTERAWNVETFGQPYVRGSLGTRRGGSGGRGRGRAVMHHNATGSF